MINTILVAAPEYRMCHSPTYSTYLTSSIIAIGAASPLRGPSLRTRVYPPLRSANLLASSPNALSTTFLSFTSTRACLREGRPPSLPKVMTLSTMPLTSFALVTVVTMRSCHNTSVVKLWYSDILWPVGLDRFRPATLCLIAFFRHQRQSLFFQTLLQFIQRLLPQLLHCHEVPLSLLQKFSNLGNLVPSQAVKDTGRKPQLLQRHLILLRSHPQGRCWRPAS